MIALALVLCLVILTLAFRLWRIDLAVPIEYAQDGLIHLVWIKAIGEHGWYLHNPNLGAPTAMDMYDFPLVEGLHLFIMKVLYYLFGDAVVVGNVFYLLTYPLTTLSAMFVFRRFGVNSSISIVGGLLYAFQPYHFARGMGHLFLAAYYILPLSIMMAVWVFLDRVKLFANREQPASDAEVRAHRWRLAGCVLICLLQASASIYYAFFTCFLLVVAGAAASLSRRQWYPALTSAVFITILFSGVVANVAPNLLYRWEHGKNSEACNRSYIEAEIYGLKIGQMILPAVGHPISKLNRTRESYEARSPVSNENSFSAMGIYASIGFLCLIGMLLKKDMQDQVLLGLSKMNVFAVLLGTVGGLGLIFNMIISPQIRCYNRLSIVIAFISLLAGGILVQRLRDSMARQGRPPWQFGMLLALTLVIGIADQIPRGLSNAEVLAEKRATCESDQAYFCGLAEILPDQAMIHQLPYVPFPGSPDIGEMKDYVHARGYLHTNHLRFSYGCMRGRPGDRWLKALCEKPVEEQLPLLAAAGFSGVSIDRRAYEDRGQELESRIAAIAHSEPIVSPDECLVFYPINQYALQLQRRLPREEWAELEAGNPRVADQSSVESTAIR